MWLREGHFGEEGLRLRTFCHRLVISLVRGSIPPLAQRLDQRQRKVKDGDGPFKGMVKITFLAEDAGHPKAGWPAKPAEADHGGRQGRLNVPDPHVCIHGAP